MKKSYAVAEVISGIEASRDDLAGDADGFAEILRALAECVSDRGEAEPQYELYKNSQLGRMIAESQAGSSNAWRWFREELLRLAGAVTSTPEFY
jgi:hypothetical protein